jgi:hypothetical protein
MDPTTTGLKFPNGNIAFVEAPLRAVEVGTAVQIVDYSKDPPEVMGQYAGAEIVDVDRPPKGLRGWFKADLPGVYIKDQGTPPLITVEDEDHVYIDYTEAATGSQLRGMATKRMDEFESRQVEWFTKDMLPRNGLVGLDGDPFGGKSAIACGYLPARMSTGQPIWDGEAFKPVNCLIVTTENHPEEKVLPQLEALGADIKRVHWHILDRDEDDLPIPLAFPEGLVELRDDIKKTKAKYVVIDPASSYYGEQINSHNDASLRRVLDPLADLAMSLDVLIVLVRHLIKDTKVTKAIYRGGGSIAFIGACRVAYLIAEKPRSEVAATISMNGDQLIDVDAGVRVLAQIGNNIGRQAHSLEFELVEAENGVVVPRWRGISGLSADDLLKTPKQSRTTEKERALEFWRKALGSRSRPVDAIYRAAEQEAGLTKDVMKKAKASRDSGIHTYQDRKGGRVAHWMAHQARYPKRRCKKCRKAARG